MKLSLAFLFALCLATLGVGQAGPNAEELKKLAFLEGSWTSKEKATRPGGEEVEFTLKGKNDWALGGTMLQIVESFEIPGSGTVHNLILMGYDAQAKAFTAQWYTNANPRPITFRGAFEAGKFVLTSIPTPGTSERIMRVTYNVKSPNEFDAKLEVKVGESFQTRTVAKYTKN